MSDLSVWWLFWIFMCAFIACGFWAFSTGHDLQSYKKDAEKEIQRLKIEKMRGSKDNA